MSIVGRKKRSWSATLILLNYVTFYWQYNLLSVLSDGSCVWWSNNHRKVNVRFHCICTCNGMRPAIDFQCGSSAAVSGCHINEHSNQQQEFRFNIFLNNSGGELCCCYYRCLLHFHTVLFMLMPPYVWTVVLAERTMSLTPVYVLHLEDVDGCVQGADITAVKQVVPFVFPRSDKAWL